MSFSIYDLDDSIRKLLNIDNFLGGMSVNDFIEELSKDQFLKADQENKLEYLDPKPYIRTFESTLRELKQLNNESSVQKVKAERDVEEYELKHSENVLQLSSQIEFLTDKFKDLDSNISEVSTKIEPLGKSLNEISSSRDRSRETIFLIRAYHGFYTKEKYDPLETLRVSRSYDDKVKCAKIVSDLMVLAKKLESPDLPKTGKCLKVIEKFSETMELYLLNRFEVASEENEFEMMREIADILYQFNGGGSVVQAFVSNNNLLLEADRAESPEESSILDNEKIWTQLSDPDYREAVRDEATEALLDRLRVAIKGQARIIQQVFQNTIPVLKIFIQRVFAQMIQNKVGTLLQYSSSIDSLAHVRVLHALYILVGDFTKDIKEFLTANELDANNELSSILDQSFYDLFVEYLQDGAYFRREKKNLEETIYSIIQKFNQYNEKAVGSNTLAAKLDSSDTNEPTKPAVENDRFSFHLLDKRRSMNFTNFVKSHLPDKNSNSLDQDRVNAKEMEEFGTININKVETILKSAIESIARILELEPSRSPEYSLEILEILIFDFGNLYISTGLEAAYENLRQENVNSKVNSSQELNLSHLHTFSLVSEVSYLLSSCIKKILLPCAVNAPNIKNRMSNLTNSYISRCEKSLNIILNETIGMINMRLGYLLSKQKKKDFLCENITEYDTEACELVSEYLNVIYDTASKNINGANLRNFLIKVGMNFLNQLLEHYKKFFVNSTGGIILTKDAIRLQSTIDEWNIKELSENYQLLKEIGNLFTVHPNLINSLITEGQLASLKSYSIKQYISKRTDFNPSYMERFFSIKH